MGMVVRGPIAGDNEAISAAEGTFAPFDRRFGLFPLAKTIGAIHMDCLFILVQRDNT